MNARILKLNKAGSPTAWINFEQAAIAMAKNQVLWHLGADSNRLHGGTQRSGVRSFFDLPTIIAVNGRVKEKSVPRISNSLLFARDQNICLYCAKTFRRSDLSRDHVMPRSRGGADTWENCVTACKRCNHHKSDRTPEEASMELCAIPFAPNLYEWFYLSNHNVLADQMDYLSSKFQNVIAV